MVIIIALVISLICSALISAAYFYRAQYQLHFQYDRLMNNCNSGIQILLNNGDSSYREPQALSLSGNPTDSIILQKYPWGIFDIGVIKTFSHRDTLWRVFSIANQIDSSKWSSVYLIDEDRPLSLSGKTSICGDARLPKAGVKTAYLDNQSYTGNEHLVKGHIFDSDRQLPPLAGPRLELIRRLFRQPEETGRRPAPSGGTTRSFRLSTRVIRLDDLTTLQNASFSGNLILYSDTTLTIDSTVSLQDVIVVAKSIQVKSGFHGHCQLYATDSLSVGSDCHFTYPSCLALFRSTAGVTDLPGRISLGEHSHVEGLIFTYEKQTGKLPPIIRLAKNTMVSGQIYSQGSLSLKEGVNIQGGVMTSRFLYASSITLYENYLVNTRIDLTTLSRYYLSSPLSPSAGATQHILQWLK
ncbi:hypothetical protein AB6735_20040 [Mucilaginibacter sp. RCC_168]|uniref:hypothetical protein n=1 Tax=Mucilaginibacter sp. RCC_168 TaxID=3239221 RepID=UPI003526C288